MAQETALDLGDCYDDEEEIMDINCPCCGVEYDEIDWEYQICHLCKFNNNLGEKL